jgi:hypothetical protein
MPSWGPYLVNELISISIGGNSNKRRRRIAFPSRIILSLVVMHCQSVHTHSTGIELEVVLVYGITKKKSILRYSHANKMNITVPLNSWRYTTDKKFLGSLISTRLQNQVHRYMSFVDTIT